MNAGTIRRIARGMSPIAYWAWAGIAIGALDVLAAYLRDRDVFLSPAPIFQSMSAACIAGAVVAAVASRVGAWAASAGVVAFALVVIGLGTPADAVSEPGWPMLRICLGIALGLVAGVATGAGAARIGEAQRGTRWFRFGLLYCVSLLVLALVWVWVTGFYAYYGVPMAVPLWALILACLLVTAFAALAAGLKIDGLVYAAVWMVLAVVPWLSGDGDGSVARGTIEPTATQHVFLIVVDTLRGDAPGYAGGSVETPNLDALASDSVVFTDAISAAPWTLPAMVSMMSGVSPLVHHAINRASHAPDELTMLAERMGDAGYRTVAVGKNPVLGKHANLTQGFDSYVWHPMAEPMPTLGGQLLGLIAPRRYGLAEVTTADLVDTAIAETRDEPMFMWLHIFDPHLPYAPPKAYLEGAPPPGSVTQYELGFEDLHRIRMGIHAPGVAEQQWIRALYDGEVRYVDAEIGRFIAHLKAANLYDDAVIILVSDHGEEFWDHGQFEHGHTLYNEVLHVPLIVKLPGNGVVKRVEEPVPTMALAATVLDLCGVLVEAGEFDAPSLRAWWESAPQALPIYSTGLLYYFDRESLIFDRRKFIDNFVTHYEELYDRVGDPGEKTNLMTPDRAGAQAPLGTINEMRRLADERRERLGLDEGAKNFVSPEAADALKSVGYL